MVCMYGACMLRIMHMVSLVCIVCMGVVFMVCMYGTGMSGRYVKYYMYCI